MDGIEYQNLDTVNRGDTIFYVDASFFQKWLDSVFFLLNQYIEKASTLDHGWRFR
jgi:hypothetical protein